MGEFFSRFGRSLKNTVGWTIAILFGATGVYSLLDSEQDDPAIVIVCLLIAAVGVWLILSVRRDRKKIEARAEEELQHRRRQEEEEKEHQRRQQAERVPHAAVECPGCGAVNRIRVGGVSRCEYCGSALSADRRK